MAKSKERRKAIKLRGEGKSYSEIKQQIKVSKSSLSLWLRNIPLSKKQLRRIESKREKTIEKYRETMRLKRQKKLRRYYDNQFKKWIPLSDREIFIAGLFLYSGEGDKTKRSTISLANTDPSVIKFTLLWIIKSLEVSPKKIKVQLQLYSDMNVEKETSFWKKELKNKNLKFLKPYIKKTKRIDIDHKGYGHGTCTMFVHDTVLKENVMMALEAIYDNYS